MADAVRDRRQGERGPGPRHRGPRPAGPSGQGRLQGREDRVGVLDLGHRAPLATAHPRTRPRTGLPLRASSGPSPATRRPRPVPRHRKSPPRLRPGPASCSTATPAGTCTSFATPPLPTSARRTWSSRRSWPRPGTATPAAPCATSGPAPRPSQRSPTCSTLAEDTADNRPPAPLAGGRQRVLPLIFVPILARLLVEGCDRCPPHEPAVRAATGPSLSCPTVTSGGARDAVPVETAAMSAMNPCQKRPAQITRPSRKMTLTRSGTIVKS